MIKNKKVRALLFTLTLAFFAVGTIAIAKEVMKKENVNQVEKTSLTKTLTFKTWRYTGTATSDPKDPSNYVLQQISDPPCGPEIEKICTVTAPDNGNGLPDLQEQMFDPITNSNKTIEDLIDRAHTSLFGTTPTTNVAVLAFTYL